MPWTTNRGYYILVIKLKEKITLSIGKLGTFPFYPGIYCYVGRAKTSLRQRLARHSKKTKALRWHIDYLLPHTEIQAIYLFPLGCTTECALAKKLAEKGGIPYPPRFGASDCRCKGHLIYLTRGY